MMWPFMQRSNDGCWVGYAVMDANRGEMGWIRESDIPHAQGTKTGIFLIYTDDLKSDAEISLIRSKITGWDLEVTRVEIRIVEEQDEYLTSDVD